MLASTWLAEREKAMLITTSSVDETNSVSDLETSGSSSPSDSFARQRHELLESTDSSSEDLLAEDILPCMRARKTIPVADANVLDSTDSSSEDLLAEGILPSRRARRAIPVVDANGDDDGLKRHGTEVFE
jgi:hypothetical protein